MTKHHWLIQSAIADGFDGITYNIGYKRVACNEILFTRSGSVHS